MEDLTHTSQFTMYKLKILQVLYDIIIRRTVIALFLTVLWRLQQYLRR